MESKLLEVYEHYKKKADEYEEMLKKRGELPKDKTPEAKAQIYILQLIKEGLIDVRYNYREGHDRVENTPEGKVAALDVLAYGRYEAYTVVIDSIVETQSNIKKNGEYKEDKET